MEVGSSNPIRFIEDALFCTSLKPLSYSDPDQKWIIRQHLISLIQSFPSLKPSIGTFTHNNGTQVKLFYAYGQLHISGSIPDIPITVWVHELYPQISPVAYVDSRNLAYPIYQNHPFVDSSSGLITCSYLMNWKFNKSSLSDLVRNLVNLFHYNHPFYYTDLHGSFAHPSMVSKTEAMDRFACMVCYDMEAIDAKNEEDIEKLSALQTELAERAESLKLIIYGLEREREKLKERVRLLTDRSDEVLSWIKVCGDDGSSSLSARCLCIDDVFEIVDEKSEVVMECGAMDLALEDLMYALDRALEEGVLSFGDYLKRVRVLAREQFIHRAKKMKFQNKN